jgi:hypothetical protein
LVHHLEKLWTLELRVRLLEECPKRTSVLTLLVEQQDMVLTALGPEPSPPAALPG